MSSVQPPESASRAGRLDQILRDLVHQTPGVEAAAVVSFDGLPMASALPVDMDEDRVAAMSAALLSLAERAAQGLGRGMLSQVYIEGEDGTVFLVSAQDEGVLIAVTAAGAKVGMMLYEVKLAASMVAEVLQAPAPAPVAPQAETLRQSLDHHQPVAAAEPAYLSPPTTYAEAVAAYTEAGHVADGGYVEYAAAGSYSVDSYSGAVSDRAGQLDDAETPEVEPPHANAVTPPSSWSSYAPSGSVLPGEQGSWG
jgi:uncharacterized protein